MFSFDKEIDLCGELPLDWSKLKGKSILITGATGMVGKFIIEVLIYRNRVHNDSIKIYAIGRDRSKFVNRFSNVEGYESVVFLEQDVQTPFSIDEKLDYVIHMASNTHPLLYASDPIGTEMSNILGTYNLLNILKDKSNCRFMFVSSGDVYGDNRSGKDFIEEDDCGYINCNTLRAGYIEGKRASEALCNAYNEKYGIDFVIARLCRIYGPTVQLTDSKAISQFIRNAAMGEDIVLKSAGTQEFSYLYTYDVVSAMLYILLNGACGEAYNVADKRQAVSLKNLANLIAEESGVKISYGEQTAIENKGASTFQNVKLDSSKLESLGWTSAVDMRTGLRYTIDSLRKLLVNE